MENIKYFEIERGKECELNDESFGDTPDRWSMCILGKRMPNVEEAKIFLKSDMELMGYDAITDIREIDYDEAHEFFDMTLENEFPIFGS